MSKKVLITGGAGFIGSHLIDDLLRDHFDVRILDSLAPQVHGPNRVRPSYLDPRAELLVGDVCDPRVVREALSGIDGVFHLAAAVGVGQSMYELRHYTASNDLGTATLLEALIEHPVERLVVASSMSIYGEGLYRRRDGELVAGAARTPAQLRRGLWELCDAEGMPLLPVATPESKPPDLASVYALSKFVQERLCLMIGRAYGIPTVALRFFNVYGPRQALSNPYTGVLAIFAARLLNGRPPVVFEDGEQRRDFVHVSDVARCCRLAYEAPQAEGQVFNVGSGRAVTITEVAGKLAALLDRPDLAPELTQKYRVGDIRHCFADISRAHEMLGYTPRIAFDDGLRELARDLTGQIAADHVEEAHHALEMRGLTA